ncbi:beta-ketoacyl-ACP synthase [Curvivirga sp.]|uniref:beta-ketoacyl-ACP synthase n=1 Tax=Curvivirga sp. TaxID=2856848 RepID=UPI003B5BA387
MRRVVVTGISGISALGQEWTDIKSAMIAGKTGVRHMKEWDFYKDLNTRLAAPIEGFDVDQEYPRKKLRSMGPVAKMSVHATNLALKDAGIELNDPIFQSGRMGVAYGSSFGSTNPMVAFGEFIFDGTMKNLTATSYIRMMSHTSAVNISTFFGITGRVIPTSTACTSGSMGIGYAYEAIKYGMQDVMVAGGAEELCPSMAAVFDSLYATSTKNETPKITPRPFDKKRDGLVIGEGAATLILEDYEFAKARGAHIIAEIVGFGTNSDGNHITQPTKETMEQALHLALDDANLSPNDIGFVSGHGTATEHGDIAESHATYSIFGNRVPYHTLKCYFGHSLGACGAMEAWLGLKMLHDKWFAELINLDELDENCADLDYLKGSAREIDTEILMSNNFAFGGINTSLIFKRI